MADDYGANSGPSQMSQGIIMHCSDCGYGYLMSTPHICTAKIGGSIKIVEGNGFSGTAHTVRVIKDLPPPNIFDQAEDLIRSQCNKDSPPTNIFDQAKDLIYGQRNKDYGHPRENFSTTAMLWNTYIDQRQVTHERTNIGPFELVEHDVAYMMALLKIARLANDPQHRDSRVDVCGYMGCADRLEEVSE